MKEIRYCPICNTPFQVNRHTNSNKKFCTKNCANKSRTNSSKKSLFTCRWCNKEFEDWTYRNRAFCSSQCRSEYGAKQPKPNKRKPETMKIDRICEICGNHFTTNTYQIVLRGGGKHCSRSCTSKAQATKMSKDGNPNYRGGISQDSKYYRGSNWNIQKRKAKKRDNHECQVCHTRGNLFNQLGVHHIKPYRLFDGDFESANQLSNLVTLCRKHHGLVEWGKIPCPKPKQ